MSGPPEDRAFLMHLGPLHSDPTLAAACGRNRRLDFRTSWALRNHAPPTPAQVTSPAPVTRVWP